MPTHGEAADESVSFFFLPPTLLTAMVHLNEACDGRRARQRRPSPPLLLHSPPGVQCNGQSTAHTKEELAYSLAPNRSLNCSCIEPVFSTPPLQSFFPHSPHRQPLQVCVFLLLFHVSLHSPSNHSVFIRRLLCELRGRTQREKDGGWECVWHAVL